MTAGALARDELWDIATTQHGFATAQQATELGISKQALQMLVHRGTVERAAHGVYRFPQYPVGEHDHLMLAVLWARVPEAALSHETALDAYGISDVNPNRIHLTVGKQRRFRRKSPEVYVVHYQALTPKQVGWWQEIPTVTPATAITQCITSGTPTYLLRQAIERGQAQGYLKSAERDELAEALEARHERGTRAFTTGRAASHAEAKEQGAELPLGCRHVGMSFESDWGPGTPYIGTVAAHFYGNPLIADEVINLPWCSYCTTAAGGRDGEDERVEFMREQVVNRAKLIADRL